MPTYDYNCLNCGYAFEVLQSIKADHLTNCSKCGQSSLKRLLGTGAGVLFKGAGFYQTDYRSKSYQQAQKQGESTLTKTPEAPAQSTTNSQ